MVVEAAVAAPNDDAPPNTAPPPLTPQLTPNAEGYPPQRLQTLLLAEEAAHRETQKELELELAAHDETAEKMVLLQQQLEMALQELAAQERRAKQQQDVSIPSNASAHAERMLREEAYLAARLAFVQHDLSKAKEARRDAPLSI